MSEEEQLTLDTGTQFSMGHGELRVNRVSALSLTDLTLSTRDREVLRGVAGHVAELAARPIEDDKRALWYRHNALEPTRPVIFCDPEDGWLEIIPLSSLECESGLARQWEMILRKEVFHGAEMGDDYVIEPVFNVAHVYPEPDWGMKANRVGGDWYGRSAIRWEAPIVSCDDLGRLRFPEIKVDYVATGHLVELAEDVFRDLLAVHLKTEWWWSLGPRTFTLSLLRGLEQVMYDLVDQPDMIHHVMAFLRDGTMAMLDHLEHNSLLSLNNDRTYVGSGGLGYSTELPQPDFIGEVRTQDMWGFGESQETVSVSPEMFNEFVFQYQLPVLERFGLNCYGCCEPLDTRWHVIEQTPRLRRVSVSAWADWAKMADLLGDDYIFSMKPNPADLAMRTVDEERIRADLRRALQMTRDCRVEVIMKDNHTINYDPQRVTRWVQIAREEAERV